MNVAITPNHNVAAIAAAPFFMLWNLFSGFMIPHRMIPLWWRWYYWVNPVAWSLYGLLTSQYGNLDTSLRMTDGTRQTVKHFLRDYFGYHEDFVKFAGIALPGFCILFGFVFALGIKHLNFQRR